MNDLEYLDWVYGGIHIKTDEPGFYVDVLEFLEVHFEDVNEI